jgi:hypothetical protein
MATGARDGNETRRKNPVNDDLSPNAADPEPKAVKTKRVDGEDLAPECFLIAGDLNDTETRKLPWKFSSKMKTRHHLLNCLMRFNETKASEDEKLVAWQKLVRLCKERSINPSTDGLRHIGKRLTRDQLYDFQKDSVLAAAHAKVRAINASLECQEGSRYE